MSGSAGLIATKNTPKYILICRQDSINLFSNLDENNPLLINRVKASRELTGMASVNRKNTIPAYNKTLLDIKQIKTQPELNKGEISLKPPLINTYNNEIINVEYVVSRIPTKGFENGNQILFIT